MNNLAVFLREKGDYGKVDDLATMLLMQRFYENLLGRYDQARSTPDRAFPAGTPLPKVEALREAKRALRIMTWDQAKGLVRRGVRILPSQP